MRRLFPILLIAILGGGAWFVFSGNKGPEVTAPTKSATATTPNETSETARAALDSNKRTMMPEDDGDEENEVVDDRPATEIYKSADEALAAVKSGAADYDDIVLEQFANVGMNCAWCREFYTTLGQMMLAQDASDDEKSYYSEILAVSGDLDNIRTLVDAVRNSATDENRDIFAESIEIAVGNDGVVKYLADEIGKSDGQLKESLVAAVTNHGSLFAVETLYQEMAKSGKPDELYDLGIGLGEVVPEDEALPRLQEWATKRDQYSPMAVRALINQGSRGLKIVFDVLSSSKNPEADRVLIVGAVDHVVPDDDTLLQYLDGVIAKNYNPVTTDFAKEIKAELELEISEEDDEE